MKFELTDSARGDFGRLTDTERELLKAVPPAFNAACDQIALDPASKWPASLRVKPVEGARGILEMTWSFRGPDGRATFEWIEVNGARAVRWRRIGGHAIFGEP